MGELGNEGGTISLYMAGMYTVSTCMFFIKHCTCAAANLPERPMRWRYVSEVLGKSKLMTTLTA